MNIPFALTKNSTSIADNKFLIFGSIITSILFGLILYFTGFSNHTLIILAGVPLFLLSVFNTELLIGIAIISLFLNIHVFHYWVVVLATIPVAISYLLTYKNNPISIKSPILIPFLVYFATILPSLYNTTDIFKCFLWMGNLFSMVVMVFITGNYTNSYQQIKRFLMTFLFFSCLNGLSIMKESIATGGDRVFGFLGVVYVDFVNIAICIAITLVLFYKNKKSLLYLFLILFLFTTLLFTQTRSTIIALVLTFVFLILYLFINSNKFSINRLKLLQGSLIVLFLVITFTLILSTIFPQVFVRFSEFFSKKNINPINESQIVSSSLVSRLLVWHTALNAFLQHPIIGMGAFSFSFDSIYYFKIPTELYKLFVKGLSPHVTYLTVLTETGIIGFLGFLFFLYSTIKVAHTAVRFSVTATQKYYSLGILTLQIYILFSMAMSDAWLFGQCGMVWGIILGISLANYRIIFKETTPFEKR